MADEFSFCQAGRFARNYLLATFHDARSLIGRHQIDCRCADERVRRRDQALGGATLAPKGLVAIVGMNEVEGISTDDLIGRVGAE